MAVHGYEYHQLIRTTPRNGFAETFDLRQVFPDAAGPVQTEIAWRAERESREDVNRRDRTRTFGYRLDCTLHIVIVTTEHQRHLVELIRRLESQEYRCEVSLDAGARWDWVRGDGNYRPEPLGGKLFAGARYELGLRGVELAEAPPELAGALGLEVYVDEVGSELPPADLWKGALFTIKPPGLPSQTWVSTCSPLGVWDWTVPPVREGSFV